MESNSEPNAHPIPSPPSGERAGVRGRLVVDSSAPETPAATPSTLPSPPPGEKVSEGRMRGRRPQYGKHRTRSESARTFARQLRQHSTDSEKHLWRLLRDRRFAEFKSRRRYACGIYFLDSVAPISGKWPTLGSEPRLHVSFAFHCPAANRTLNWAGAFFADMASISHWPFSLIPMKTKLCSLLIIGVGAWFSAGGAEVSFKPVALRDQSAPGLSNNVHFSSFNDFSLADDGWIAFTANVSGPGMASTNNLGLWGGLPGGQKLIVRTGDPAPSQGQGISVKDLWAPNLDNHQYVGILAEFAGQGPGGVSTQAKKPGKPVYYPVPKETLLPGETRERTIDLKALGKFIMESWCSFVINAVAGRIELFGPDIGFTNNIAIVAGPPTNAAIVARIGFPAPGVTGDFISVADAPGLVALMPNGKVAFVAGTTAEAGVWLGNGDGVEGVALTGHPAPVSPLGSGYTFFLRFGLPGSENLEVNGRGELAFSTYLNGPGLNATNSEFVVAGTPEALRVVAQEGQPAPGIPGAFFRRFDGGSSSFSHVLLGADGAVVFVGCYSTNGKDFGLWLAPTNGATPLLLMRTGQQAPGAPAGVVFEDTSIYVPPFRQAFMNSRNQVVFRARLGGPGIGSFSFGIWLAEPDGTVSLVARVGDMIDTGDGTLRQLDGVSFGADPVFMAGPEDGRRCPFNDRGEVALLADFTDATGGVFVAQTGINLDAERAGNDIRIRFPTLAGKTYRVDYSTNLPATSWPMLQDSVSGNGRKVTVTDTNAVELQGRFYRAVRTD
jgi:hypothetical protein